MHLDPYRTPVRQRRAPDAILPEIIIQSALDRLYSLRDAASVELRLIETPAHLANRTFHVALTPMGHFLEDEPLSAPALTATLTYAAFLEMVNGAVTPLQAYLDGSLRLKGDLELAYRIGLRLRDLFMENRRWYSASSGR